MLLFSKGSYSYESVKEAIVRDLALRKPRVFVSSFGEKVFLDAIAADPRILVYLYGYSVRLSLFSSSAIDVHYHNEKVKLSDVEYAKTKEDAEGMIQYALTRFKPMMYLIFPSNIDVRQLLSDFTNKYMAMYPGCDSTEAMEAPLDFPLPFRCIQILFKYKISRYKLNQMNKQLNGEVSMVCKKIFLPSMPPLVKAYVAHNYLVRNVKYWKEDPTTPEETVIRHSAYGALIRHRCVCQGYAEAFQRLMDSQGIENYYLFGSIKDDPSGLHGWNLVAIDNVSAFHVDTTWDAQYGIGKDVYFGLSDREMIPKRTWSRKFGKPALSDKNWAQEARRIIQNNLSLYLRGGIDKKYLVL